MKRYFLIIILFLISFVGFSQAKFNKGIVVGSSSSTTKASIDSISVVAGKLTFYNDGSAYNLGQTSYVSKAQLYFDRLPELPSTAKMALVSHLCDTLTKIFGDSIDCVYDFTMPYLEQGMVNMWSGKYTCTYGGGALTYVSGYGLTGGGVTNSYLNTNFDYTTAVGAKYSTNLASIHIYVQSDILTDDKPLVGVFDGDNDKTIIDVRTSTMQGYLNTASGQFFSSWSHSNTIHGFHSVVRLASNSMKAYYNGVEKNSTSYTSSATSGSLWLLARNSATTSTSTNTISFVLIGNLKGVYKLNQIIEWYMDQQGIGVQ